MKLRFPIREIPKWAAQYAVGPLEADVLELRPQILRAGHMTRSQLHLMARWKSERSAPRVLHNSESYIREVTRFALSTDDERARIESLTILDGLSWPTASVVLHLYHRDPYPLLDVRALWSVGVDASSKYTFDLWSQYVTYCRKLVDRSGAQMRGLDRALWQYSAHQGSPA